MSSRSTRHRHINPHIQAIKEQQKKDQHAKLTIHLHVKVTSRKGKQDVPIPLKSTTFTHSSLKNISAKKKWDSISSLIISVVETTEFKKQFGSDATFDPGRGILGWKGSRDVDENPCYGLRGKAPVKIENNDEWELHSRTYRSKNEDEKDKEKKFLLLDLGIAVYDDMKECEYVLKQSKKLQMKTDRQKRKTVVSPSPIKKMKKGKSAYVFKAPEFLDIEVVEPIEYDGKKDETKTGSIHPLGVVEVDFTQFVLQEDNVLNSDDCSDILDRTSSEEGDANIGMIEILERSDGNADDICEHIYEPIRHILGSVITENKSGEYSKYKDKIGKKVSFYFIFL